MKDGGRISSPSDGGDIIVTARKRNESTIDVPIALSVLTADALTAQNVKGLQDIQNGVPGLFYQERGSFQTYVSIRGVGGDSRNIALESGVSITIDGVTIGRSNAFNMDLANIAQVEVLRGPQGTLFGTNTIGGAINITTEKPSDEIRAKATLNYGNYGTARTQAALSGPLSDTLAAGASISSWNSRGYLYNSFKKIHVNGQDRLGGRLQLRWTPTERLEVNLSGDATRDRRQEALNQNVAPFIGYAAQDIPPDRFTISAAEPAFNNRDVYGANATVDYDLGGDFSVKSISSYRRVETDMNADSDSVRADISHSGPYQDHSSFLTQELRLVSPARSRLRFVAGLFYSRQDASQYRALFNLGQTTTLDSEILTNTYAGYLNGDFDLTDRLTLNAGARYNSEVKDGQSFQGHTSNARLRFSFPDLHRKDDAVSWTGSVKYKFSPDASTYVTVSRGFKSGGFNVDTLGAAAYTVDTIQFRPESVTNYEAGLKLRALDRALQFNIAVFQLDYSDRQVLQFNDPGAGLQPFTTIDNAASSRTRGIELDGSLHLAGGWTLSGSFAHLDAKYRNFPRATLAGADYSGNFTEQAPKYTGSIAVDYRGEISDRWRVVVHADASYQGKTYFDAANNPQNVENGYWLLNGRAGFERDLTPDGNTLGIFAYVRNATNEAFFLFKRQSGGVNQGVYGLPRFYGVELSYKY
ncbi:MULTISPECIES: TonB-dependent receptor [unclassified Sphingomonas]|uniref:TonB-dependent receptor n=1 Tax=unclassified Sphingomonas TaxID=196159 RepID=UPI0006FC400D|nr:MULTISPECIES: TonB-dependent receptor [unclassified Sphingomonas]KQX25145.1 hypothetical protein ASD17_24085 [Sphingomonas sp. Root1294]KQY66162.1 hypothetical protein ASD39_13885 [Sphingomonas sp. Root50]KRB89673.1 hypothetical protein ASE22_18710 [Sphingomonas sp. Root720]